MVTVLTQILRFFKRNDQGQDVAEYCLLTALVALIALGIFYHVSGGLQGMWSTADTSLAASNTSVPAAGSAPATPATR